MCAGRTLLQKSDKSSCKTIRYLTLTTITGMISVGRSIERSSDTPGVWRERHGRRSWNEEARGGESGLPERAWHVPRVRV